MEAQTTKKSLNFMPQLDGLRFIAVFSVMMFHWELENIPDGSIFKKIPFGSGVNLFFVISGFLITHILLNKKDDILEQRTSFFQEIKRFYAKRVLRIFPVYYLLITIVCLFSYDTIKNYLVYLLTYTTNWYIVFKGDYIGNLSHLWSLAVEEQFYLIWPFLIFIIPKRWMLSFVLFSIIIGVISKVYFAHSPYWIGVDSATFSCFDSLGLGALIAYIQKKRKASFNQRLYKILLLISVIAYVLLFMSPGYLTPYMKGLFLNFATSVVYFFAVIIAANNGFKGIFRLFLENKVVLYLGRISYGLYLYHTFAPLLYYNTQLNHLFLSFTSHTDIFIMYFVVIVIVATISWYLVERPLLRLKKYFQ